LIDAGEPVAAVACPSTSQCAAVDTAGREISFNPASPKSANVVGFDPGSALYAVTCPSTSECVTVDGNGAEITFNPSAPSTATAHLVDGGQTLYGVSCPASTQCTAVDRGGNEVTFDPATGSVISGPTIVDAATTLNHIACPSTSECSAVDASGQEVTWNPIGAAIISGPATVDPGNGLNAVSCPTTSECAAVDVHGQEVAYNPATGALIGAVTRIAGTRAIFSVACGSPTTCTAGDNLGQIVTFDPQNGTVATGPSTVDGNLFLLSIACPAANECVAGDQYGRVVAGDPSSAQSWTIIPISGATALDGVACGSTTVCVAVDITSNLAVGTGPSITPPPPASGSPSVPVNSAVPTITGTDVAGDTLTEHHGTWTNNPTGYTYQWERCNTAAHGCKPIVGAGGQTYTLTAADVGSTIAVTETASNATGQGAPATSGQTPTVLALGTHVAPPTVGIVAAHINSKKRTASFQFKASAKSARFQCALVRLPARKGAKAPKPKYVACQAKKTFRHLKPGHFKFYVRAVGPGGTSKVATYGFTIR
jgi:hypothetical protein